MKKRFHFLLMILMVVGFTFTACETTDEDLCSSELGNVGPDYGCTVPVMPEICTIDGVDDHWVLNGVEYSCPNGDCTVIPEDLVNAIRSMEGCSGKKSIDFAAVNLALSEKAKVILEKLHAEAVLCLN
ncbi:MAG: hypothetical protein CVU09_06320 [Bacteroidetes bacterium HGW-Bacteroidetes-4]|jgi:hypothetical protein|nr:MAG: hypothetical protein CVU09_06320 [Bacteroidetes bacterium HGW-Bacteroidetes-4]